MKIQDLILILVSVLLTAVAQMFLKSGMNALGKIEVSFHGLVGMAQKSLTNAHLYFGFAAFAASVFIWLIALSRVNVSVAYPFVGAGCIFTALLAHFFLGESLGVFKILGIAIICLGIFILTRDS